MKKTELLAIAEECKASPNSDRYEIWLEALTRYILEQPKAPEVERPSKAKK